MKVQPRMRFGNREYARTDFSSRSDVLAQGPYIHGYSRRVPNWWLKNLLKDPQRAHLRRHAMMANRDLGLRLPV